MTRDWKTVQIHKNLYQHVLNYIHSYSELGYNSVSAFVAEAIREKIKGIDQSKTPLSSDEMFTYDSIKPQLDDVAVKMTNFIFKGTQMMLEDQCDMNEFIQELEKLENIIEIAIDISLKLIGKNEKYIQIGEQNKKILQKYLSNAKIRAKVQSMFGLKVHNIPMKLSDESMMKVIFNSDEEIIDRSIKISNDISKLHQQNIVLKQGITAFEQDLLMLQNAKKRYLEAIMKKEKDK